MWPKNCRTIKTVETVKTVDTQQYFNYWNMAGTFVRHCNSAPALTVSTVRVTVLTGQQFRHFYATVSPSMPATVLDNLLIYQVERKIVESMKIKSY